MRLLLCLVIAMLGLVEAGSLFSKTASTSQKKPLNVGLLVPHTSFGQREYFKAIKTIMTSLQRRKFEFMNKYEFSATIDMLGMTPSPTGKKKYARNTLV